MINKVSSIQIIGTQRSGSNLLRLILNQFDEISAPHPPHVLKTFALILSHYGNLNKDENFHLLANDIADYVNANPVPWNQNHLKAKELIARARNKSLLSLYEMLYVIKAEQDNAKIWCCKSMFNEYYVKEIEEEGIKPFYIYMYRDGRDVAASFKKAIIGPKHIYHIATKWRDDQKKALQIKEVIEAERYCMVQYEELIRNPEEVLRKLSAKLGLQYSPKLLNYYESSESRITASSGEMWKNVAKPIIRNNILKYRTELSSDEIHLFEQITGDVLMALGYSLDTDNLNVMREFSSEEIEQFNIENRDLQKAIRKSAPRHDLEVRSKQEEVIFRVKQRFNIH